MATGSFLTIPGTLALGLLDVRRYYNVIESQGVPYRILAADSRTGLSHPSPKFAETWFERFLNLH